MFVIQYKPQAWKEKYKTYHGRYETADEARAALEKMPKLMQIDCRIAEEYTVTRYKAVK